MIKYFLIGLGIVAIGFIALMIVKAKKRKKEIINKLSKLSSDNGYEFIVNKDKTFLIKGEKTLLIDYVEIPPNSSVTINSKSTWCLRWGGKRYGRGYPNQRYLNELNDFLKLKVDYIKVIILYKTTEKILMYLNESEIATVDEGKKVYDYKVVTFDNLENVFPKLFE